MLRLTELRLPLEHSEQELRAAILRELGIRPAELAGYSVFRRGFDSRKKNAVAAVYHLDVETPREAEVLAAAPRQPACRADAGHVLPLRRPRRRRSWRRGRS